MTFLPATPEACRERGWDELDFLLISADAYVDHPSFGTALLGRLLEERGYRVGILAQPDVNDPEVLTRWPRPLLAVLISSGVVDSMVNNYTAARRPRRDDRYSPGGKAGLRPDRVTIRYANMVRSGWGDIPVIIGGMEASLRRFAHYDYWDHQVRRSILQDSQADILVYGMGERPLLKIAELLSRGVPAQSILTLPGTCVMQREEKLPPGVRQFLEQTREAEHRVTENSDYVLLPALDEVTADKKRYAEAFRLQALEQNPQEGRSLLQWHGRRWVLQNPPAQPLAQDELDRLYDLPFERRAHPMYDKQGGVPALDEVQFSITAHRGCFGSCSFCAITFHQGRLIRARSDRSVIAEAVRLTEDPDFKGYIHDIGGPTANFHLPACDRMDQGTFCRDRRCLHPKPCPALRTSHTAYANLLEQVRHLPGVKKVFVRSGLRYDVLLADPDGDRFLEQLCRHHVSGQLKVAPEHVAARVLDAMGKPGPETFERFRDRFTEMNRIVGKKQFLVPYLMSGHPGSTLDDAIELAVYCRRNRMIPEQVQDFYPTPGTVATTMYYTGLDPMTMRKIHVPDPAEKRLQRALLQFHRPAKRALVEEALRRAGRADLIGTGPDCLIPPSAPESESGSIAAPRAGRKPKGGRSEGRPPRHGESGRGKKPKPGPRGRRS